VSENYALQSLGVRLFVAAQLPDDVVSALSAWCPRVAGLRSVAPESLHLTLAFLGSRTEAEAAAAAAVVRTVAAPADGLSLGSARWLPAARRPRVLAVSVEDPTGALGALRRSLVDGLGAAMGFEPDRRAFLAHVTVARVRSGTRVRGVALDGVPDAGTFPATALSLMRSHLSSSPRAPARYEALETVAL